MFEFLQASAGLLALVALVIALLALAVAVGSRRRDTRAPAPSTITTGVDDRALGRVLDEQAERVEALGADQRSLVTTLEGVTRDLRSAVQHVGVVRFNPFEDTGSNQSFALAMLDDEGDGFILSSLHSRQATRVYLKEVEAGRCESALSDEETEALRRAGLRI